MFQSTHPSRGATFPTNAYCYLFWCFNPRTPRGVRPMDMALKSIVYPFQSTHPSRGATIVLHLTKIDTVVSIHAPLAGCDRLLLSSRG